ncbi:hypothetical protein M3Y99_01738500 [Aphelenchoides fujianensis]|nr:hypothetical protein M3Y99_01738500 [Aphelenchoides fujianensis]
MGVSRLERQCRSEQRPKKCPNCRMQLFTNLLDRKQRCPQSTSLAVEPLATPPSSRRLPLTPSRLSAPPHSDGRPRVAGVRREPAVRWATRRRARRRAPF